MKRTDLELIQRYLANLRPNLTTDPVVMHTEWRRVVAGLGEAFRESPWAHLHDPAAWLHGTGAEVLEPAPREGEPYERDGAWYNLTESEALARGLVADTSAPRWLIPRNLDSRGQVVRDEEGGQVIDAVTGEWRDMTGAERARWPRSSGEGEEDPANADAREGDHRRGQYCRVQDPTGRFVCTRPPGHEGCHIAVRRGCGDFRSASHERCDDAPVCNP